MQTLKVDPLPSSLFTDSLPPIASVRLLQIESPRPVPLALSAAWLGSCTWTNGSSTRVSMSGGMPQPESETASSRFASLQAAATITDP